MRSIDRLLPLKWVAKDFKTWKNLQTDVETFPLAKEHHLIQFEMEAECEVILQGAVVHHRTTSCDRALGGGVCA